MIKEIKPDPFALARSQMVRDQLQARDIRDEGVLRIMGRLPRERFIGNDQQHLAYDDRAVPIAMDQTISQPYMVALMTEQLQVEAGQRVLEIGTGSGYQTAVLAELAGEVFTVERIELLSRQARKILERLGIANVHYKVDDGTMGWPERAPFDRILVTAGAPRVPAGLAAQLADGGILIIPVGSDRSQTLTRVYRRGESFTEEPLLACRFVKLIGRDAWPKG